MSELNSNELSLIEYMKRSEEHLRKGVSLINDRGNPGRYFDAIHNSGLLAPANNPRPVPTEDGQFYQVPYWPMLDYMASCARQAAKMNDLVLAAKVMQLIRDISLSITNNKDELENYHTYRVFGEILGLLPRSAVSIADIDLIPNWLDGRFDRGGVCNALDKGAMTRFLESDVVEDHRKALRIMEHCTAIRWVTKDGFAGSTRREPVSVVDNYWLREMVKHHAATLGRKLGEDTVNVFARWVREVYRRDENQLPSYMSRPAIEQHRQNYDWKGVENCSVEALRDALIAWVSADVIRAKAYVANLLQDELEIIQRIAIYAVNTQWDELGELLPTIMNVALLDRDVYHELYGLLHARFALFPESLKKATVNAIESIPLASSSKDPELLLAHVQRRWLSAIASQGSERADQLYAALSANEKLGQMTEHPDFLAYSVTRVGPGPSPYSPQELVALNGSGDLLKTLTDFEPDGSWDGPTTRALVDSLEAAVELDPNSFLDTLSRFLAAKRCYQYGVLNGFKKLWERTAKDTNFVSFDWNAAWPQLFRFCSQLFDDDKFWSEETIDDENLTPTRDWIPSLVADFIRVGSKNDEKAFSTEWLPTALKLVDQLLVRTKAVDAPEDDAMHQAINSQKGRAIEALYTVALRSARHEDRTIGHHRAAWGSIEAIFDRELDDCRGANFEFSTLLGTYLANLEYLNIDWLESRIKDIFPQQFPQNFLCALNGLAYGQATRRNFSLLRDNNIINVALAMNLSGDHTREKLVERIALAYLWGDESLDSMRFATMFDCRYDQDLEVIAKLFWSFSNQDLSDEQVARIMSFWRRCVDWADGITPVPEALLSKLTLLSCYLKEISDIDLPLLLASVPYVNEANFSWELTETLERLASKSPQNVVKILDKFLENHNPSYDYEGRLCNLVLTLSQHGQRAAALRFAEKFRSFRGMSELFDVLVTNCG